MTQNKRQNLLREGAVLVLVIAAVAVSEYVFFQLWRLDWQVPMLYGGDGIYWVGQVQRSYGDLTPALGWPFYQPPSPYEPNYDLIYDAFVAFVGLFTQNTGIVFNLYVLAIPFANALAGYAVFRLAGVRRWLAFAFALTFGLCPYVQQRLAGHMMLAAVEFVPFSVLLCLWCAEDPAFARPGKGFFRNRRNWAALAMAWGMVFLTHAQGGVAAISRKSWLFLILSGLATGASWLCYYRALQLGKASQVAPIDKLSVVITLVLAFVFLREEVTAKSLAGCVLICAGTLLMVL